MAAKNDNETETVHDILAEACHLEILVADIYTVFEHAFPVDASFWHQLASEEKNHAALLERVRTYPDSSKEFLADFTQDSLIKEYYSFFSSSV